MITLNPPKRGRPRNRARDIALASGAIRFNGTPCRKGHGVERYASTGACVVCMGAHGAAKGRSGRKGATDQSGDAANAFAAIWE